MPSTPPPTLGMVVVHDTAPCALGHGSAIFLHVWSDAASPTSGCTAMARAEVAPLLVQVPQDQLTARAQRPSAAAHAQHLTA